jgi:hypothetical protein
VTRAKTAALCTTAHWPISGPENHTLAGGKI